MKYVVIDVLRDYFRIKVTEYEEKTICFIKWIKTKRISFLKRIWEIRNIFRIYQKLQSLT